MSTRKYAEDTVVSIDRSKSEIEKNLAKHGATEFGYMVNSEKAIVVFQINRKQVKFVLLMPKVESIKRTATGKIRSNQSVESAYEQECRRLWRALCLVIKAKLEAVATGIVTFEEEFLAQFVLPSGETFAERFVPQIEDAYRSGKIRGLLE